MTSIEEIPQRSMSAVRARDKQGWLALFEADAVVEDPVGGHALLDPAGEGHRGIAAIGRFYDLFSGGQESFDFTIHHCVACGREVACFASFDMVLSGGLRHKLDLIIVYRISSDDRIQSLRAFWR